VIFDERSTARQRHYDNSVFSWFGAVADQPFVKAGQKSKSGYEYNRRADFDGLHSGCSGFSRLLNVWDAYFFCAYPVYVRNSNQSKYNRGAFY
jgi:hypothetical protein